MSIWKTIPLMTAFLVAQAASPSTSPTPNRNAPQVEPATVPLYRLTVVQGSAKAMIATGIMIVTVIMTGMTTGAAEPAI